MYKNISRSYTITIEGSVETVFPLFTPEEEKKWADGWDFDLIFPSSGEIQEGFIFSTKSHDHKENEALWIISRYKPEDHRISYHRFEPGIKIGTIQISCKQINKNLTQVNVIYQYTGLSTDGNRFFDSFSEKYYQEFIKSWATAINYFLETGKTLSLKHS